MKNKSEVEGMLDTEYNEAEVKELFVEEGRKQGIDTTIKNMLSSGGFTDEQICVATGKTLEYIIKFKNEIVNK